MQGAQSARLHEHCARFLLTMEVVVQWVEVLRGILLVVPVEVELVFVTRLDRRIKV